MMKDAPKQIEKLEDIFDVTRFCDSGRYIFRGENKDYVQVTSGLYREYSNEENPLTEEEGFSILDVEKQIIDGARKHLPDGASNIEVLTALQHFGGKTNLIDFTKNLYIALFFACDGKFSDDGQLILVDKRTLDDDAINYNTSKAATKGKHILAFPTGKSPREIFQSSAFVHPRKGYLKQDDYTSVTVKAELKGKLLLYLEKHHDISAETVYNDIHGFIENQSIDTMANKELFLGFSCSEVGNFEGGISHYNKAIKLNPQMLTAYTNRGLSFAHLKRYDKAIADHTKVIELQPRRSFNYFLRGMTYKLADKLDAAMVDCRKAIEIGPPRADYYVGLGEVYNRLQKHNDAMKEFKKALQIDSHYQAAYQGLGVTCKHLGNHKAALAHLRIARDLNIQKKLLDQAEILTSAIAELEDALAKNTRPNAKAIKKAPAKPAKSKKRKK